MQTRVIQEVGTRAWLRIFTHLTDVKCPVSVNQGCEAQVHLEDTKQLEAFRTLGGEIDDYPDWRWPVACDACSRGFSQIPLHHQHRQILRRRLYDTPSGEPEPGSIYIVTTEHWESEFTSWQSAIGNKPCEPTSCVYRWSNCDGRHIQIVMPDGWIWCASGRASNCTLPDDQEHRCWVLSGPLKKLTASKAGKTCAAGAGSILTRSGWHGYIVDGVLKKC